jgi:hypothetical protein
MSGITLFEVQIVIAMGLFLSGAISLATGIIVLVVRSSGKEVRTLADQTTQLAKKGLAEDVPAWWKCLPCSVPPLIHLHHSRNGVFCPSLFLLMRLGWLPEPAQVAVPIVGRPGLP